MDGPRRVIERLVAATNQHDLDALVACFADGYVNETPAHPARGFRGQAQVRRNWETIFAFVPDIKTQVVRTAVDADAVWTEWEMRGTRRDGTAHRMSGVVVFGIIDDLIHWARFYLEPVDSSNATVNDAVREHVVRQ